MRTWAPLFVLLLASQAQTSDLTFRRISADQPYPQFCSVSRDGSLVSYLDSKTGNLAVRELATGRIRLLTNTGSPSGAHAMWSIFSPDSREIAFVWADASAREIRVMNLDGSGARTLSTFDAQNWMVLNDWSPEGKQLLIARTHYGTNTDILLMSVSDGSITKLRSQPISTGRMAFSADGSWIAHNGPAVHGGTASDIYVLSRDGRQDHAVVSHPAEDSLLGWAADGARIFFTSDRTGAVGLWSVGVHDGHTSEAPRMIKDELGRVAAPLGVTESGVLYFASTVSQTDIYEAAIDLRAGALRVENGPVTHRFAGANSYPSWSPDDSSFSFLANPASGQRAIVVQHSKAEDDRVLVPKLAWFNRPEWLRRGLVAVTGSDAKGLEGLYGVDPSTGQVQLLIGKEQNETVFHGQWSSDGRFFYNRHTDARQGLYRLDIHTGAKQTIYIPPAPWRVAGTALSPNDGQLAFEEDNYAAGLSRLRLLALDGKSEARDLWTTPPGEQFPCCRPFTWSPDSRRLLIVKSADSVGSLWELDVDTDTVHRLALSVRGLMNPSLSTDGSRLLYQAGEERSEIWAVENVR